MGVSYVLPLRWTRPGPIEELAAYLRLLGSEVDEALVVDGSPASLFEQHAEALRGVARHLPPHSDLDFRMGKVNGVVTGVRECSHERVVLADDDVRYDCPELRRTVDLLGEADLVRPQNYFNELPWHARWDTARSLLNRVFTGDPTFPVGDFPGTLAVRREAFLASGAYDGDALFENLELMRTIRASGGVVLTPLDLYVARRPPDAAQFLSQRVRQAYDDFAIPARLCAFLAVVPLVSELVRRGHGHRAARGGAGLGRRRRARTKESGRSRTVPALLVAAGAGMDRGARDLLVAGASSKACGGSSLWRRARQTLGDVDAPPAPALLRIAPAALGGPQKAGRSRLESESPCESRRRRAGFGSARTGIEPPRVA